MKKVLISILLLIPFVVAAQKGFTITGKLTNLKTPAIAYFARVKGDKWIDVDSTQIKNGTFKFTGNLSEPERVVVRVKHTAVSELRGKNDQIDFYLENAKVLLNATDSIKKAAISGSNAERENRELQALITPITYKTGKLMREFTKGHDLVAGKTLEQRKVAQDSINSYTAQSKAIRQKFVETHLNSFMGLYTYNLSILGSSYNSAEVKPLFYKFSPQLQSSPLGMLIIDRILANEKRAVGVQLIDFSQTDINGKPFQINSLRGKYVFLDFWASWCYWCRKENPNVLKAYEQLKDRNLEIVSVSFDENKASWENAVKEDKLPWLQVSDLKGMKVKDGLAATLDIKAIPQNLLISPEGIIIATNLRGEDLAEKISALIK